MQIDPEYNIFDGDDIDHEDYMDDPSEQDLTPDPETGLVEEL